MRLERVISHSDPQRLLSDYRRRPLNLDPSRRDEYLAEKGWHVDDFSHPLLAEPPGPPLPDGPFELAKRIMWGYEFADPSIVRAYYDPAEPLEGRTMVLELNFHGLLHFDSGVRVTGVHDDRLRIDGREVYAWGWDYATLQGHLEQGQMDWRVWKWADTGALEFRIHSFSKRSRDPNLIVRLGFRLFGRREQLAFLHSTLGRMARLIEAGTREGGHGLREASRRHTVRSATRGDEQIHEQLVENVGR